MEYLEKYAPYILIFALFVLLLVVASPLGVESKGARRWLRVGPFTIQPSEFSKIALVVYMAKFLSDKRDDFKDFRKGFAPAVAIMAVFSILIMLERDLGTIVLMGAVVTGMWALAKVRITHLATVAAAAIPVLIFLVFQHSYRLNRISAFTDPEKYALTTPIS
jgi:cell division protein FtsW